MSGAADAAPSPFTVRVRGGSRYEVSPESAPTTATLPMTAANARMAMASEIRARFNISNSFGGKRRGTVLKRVRPTVT